MFHKQDDVRRRGLGSRGSPRRCAAAAPTTRSRREPRRAVAQRRSGRAVASIDFSTTPTADIAALDELGREGRLGVRRRRAASHQPRQAAVPGPDKREKPLTKRDLIRYYAMIAPVMVPYLGTRPHQHAPVSRTESTSPASGTRRYRAHAPEWITPLALRRRRRGRDRVLHRRRPPRDPCMARQLRRDRVARVDVADPRRAPPDLRDDRRRPGREDDLGRGPDPHPPLPGRARPPGCVVPEGHRPAGHPDLGADEPGPTFERHATWVEALSRRVGGAVPELVSWKWEKRARGGLARLDYTQNAINKTLVAPYSVRPAAGAPVSMPIRWDELDDPDLRSDRWTIRDAGRAAPRSRRPLRRRRSRHGRRSHRSEPMTR